MQESNTKVSSYKKEIVDMMQKQHRAKIDYEQIVRSSRYLVNFVSVSEYYRKKFSEKLREVLSKNDEQSNEIFELK